MDEHGDNFSQLKKMNGENKESQPNVFQSKSSGFNNAFIVLSIFNIFLAITATLSNTLIFLALGRGSCLHAPSKLLIRSLAFIDLCVGLISQPLAALHTVSILTKHLQIFQFTVVSCYVTSAILSGVSLFVLTFISIDRLLALSLGIRYRQTVTTKRVRIFVIVIWIVNIANAVIRFLGNRFVFYIVCLAGILFCVVVSTFCYVKICRTLRVQRKKVWATVSEGRQPNQSSQQHVEKYKKTVLSALWVHFTLLACYLPYSIVSGLKAITGDTFAIAEGFTATLVFFNSSVNPVLYCWRMREVRQAVKETIKQYCGFSNEAQANAQNVSFQRRSTTRAFHLTS